MGGGLERMYKVVEKRGLIIDLHIHSSYYPGAMKNLTIETLSSYAKLKGLDVIGTGDALHPQWRKKLKEELKYLPGQDIYEKNGVYFIPSVEVKLNTYVHSVIILPTLDAFDELYDVLKNYGKIEKTGAPFVYIDGEEIYEIVNELGGFLFPAHVFIPFQSLYAKYNSFREYFGKYENKIFSVEISPSVDNPMAEQIEDICNKIFLTNSDCHTPMHLGRNFNLLIDTEPTYKSIMDAIKHNRVINYVMPAALGKYYETGCKNCKTFYTFESAKMLDFKCELCGGRIWVGTKDRIKLIKSKSAKNNQCHKEHKFKYHIPLTTIFSNLLGIKNPNSEILEIIKKYPEIPLIHFLDLADIEIPEKLKKAIRTIRENKYYVYPGGAWKEGKISFKKEEVRYYQPKQKTLWGGL